MPRLSVAALAVIASITSATAGDELIDLFGNPLPTYPAVRPLEKITGYPIHIVMPLKRPDATELSLSALPFQKAVVKKTILRNEWGGRIDQHRMRFASYNASGDDIEIRGTCHSACTLVMSIIPANRICFSAQGYLSFHKASTADGKASYEHTMGMIKSYPTGIQKWIEDQGGYEAMPHTTAWVLAAPDLWKMGYRKCD